MRLSHDDGWTIPADSPFYPPLPAVYRNVKWYLALFNADTDAVARFLPEPLEASPDGVCAAGGLDVPYSSNYGPFLEAFLVLKCRFRGQAGYYCSHVFHNGPAGIAAGREIYGTPKIYADLSVRTAGRAVLTEASLGGVTVFGLSAAMGETCSADALPNLTPAWRLKIIPRADGPGPAIKQLVDCSSTMRDQVIHYCARAKATLALRASPLVDLSPLQPVSYGEAFYVETSYSEHYAEIAYDYLRADR